MFQWNKEEIQEILTSNKLDGVKNKDLDGSKRCKRSLDGNKITRLDGIDQKIIENKRNWSVNYETRAWENKSKE